MLSLENTTVSFKVRYLGLGGEIKSAIIKNHGSFANKYIQKSKALSLSSILSQFIVAIFAHVYL